jgi:hypothetical protein
MKHTIKILLAPLICLIILAAMHTEVRARIQPADAEPYHQRAKAAISSLPYQLNGWIGRDDDIPPAAIKLLHPNYMVSRTYIDPLNISRSAGLLIVQCKDSRDMLGHYPPVCYPAHGMTKISEQQRDWSVGDNTTIPGTEYVFSFNDGISKSHMAVYNFMIVPNVGIVRDMTGVEHAAKNYQQRFFGAAQFQVTMNADMPQFDRDRIFAALVGANLKMIDTLKSGGSAR